MALKDDIKDLSLVNCLLIGCGLMAAYYFFIFDKGDRQTTEIATIQDDLSLKTTLLAQVNQAKADKVAFQRESEILENEMKQLLVYLPAQLDMNQMQAELTLHLQESNNKIQSLKNAQVQSRFPGYTEHGLDLQSVGGFHDVMMFLSAVTKMNRIVDFKTMEFDSLGPGESGSLIQFKTLISVFQKDASENKTDASEIK